jgi:hypothetical protein
MPRKSRHLGRKSRRNVKKHRRTQYKKIVGGVKYNGYSTTRLLKLIRERYSMFANRDIDQVTAQEKQFIITVSVVTYPCSIMNLREVHALYNSYYNPNSKPKIVPRYGAPTYIPGIHGFSPMAREHVLYNVIRFYGPSNSTLFITDAIGDSTTIRTSNILHQDGEDVVAKSIIDKWVLLDKEFKTRYRLEGLDIRPKETKIMNWINDGAPYVSIKMSGGPASEEIEEEEQDSNGVQVLEIGEEE